MKACVEKTLKMILLSLFAAIMVVSGVNCVKIGRYKNLIEEYSQKYGVSPSLVYAVIKCESNFNPKSLSKKGAYGLMQIKKETFIFVCEKFHFNYNVSEIYSPTANIEVGVAYLSYLYDKFYFDYEVLVAYNAGEGNLRLWLADERYSVGGERIKAVPFKETANYANKVLKYEKIFKVITYESSCSKMS